MAMVWSDLTSRPRARPSATIAYGEGSSFQAVDVWLPQGDGPHPAVLMVHGGCWRKSIADRTLMDWAAEDLRARGIAVWNVEYRGVDEPGGGFPGTFLDVAAAADAMRAHADRFALDLKRVVAVGHSAGGHLALWLAARPRLPRPSPLHTEDPLRLAGVVNSGGLADLAASRGVAPADCLAEIYDALIGAGRADPLADTSPAERLPLGVPQICVSGGVDRIAPPALGEAWAAKARAAGDDARAIVVDGEGHVELIAPGTRAWDATAGAIEAWLRR